MPTTREIYVSAMHAGIANLVRAERALADVRDPEQWAERRDMAEYDFGGDDLRRVADLAANLAETKGTARVGRRKGRLTDAEMIVIRQRAEAGERQSDLARHFRVSTVTVHAVVHRRVYRDVA
jgi:hypothetical protein